MMKKEPVKRIIGSTYTFRQYMCSKCQRNFYIQKKEGLSLEESFEEETKVYQSPCCKPYHQKLMGNSLGRDIEPHGIYIRELKLKVDDITDEIALVHKRRVNAESGKPDPYADNKKDTDKEDNEE